MISFIIVNYKSHIELERCLQDLSHVSYSHLFNVIIVNNDTKKLDLQKYNFNNQKIYEINKNIGYARANNIGLKNITTKYICFLNPDTHSFDYNLHTITTHIKKNTIVSPRILSNDGSPQEWSIGDKITLWQIIKNNFGLQKKLWNTSKKIPVDWVTGAALFTRKDVVKKLGGFDEDFFLYFEDVDLCTRLRKEGGTIFYVPNIQLAHSSGASSKKTRKFQKKCYYKSQDLFFKKHVGKLQLSFLRAFRLFHK
ncbi:MAG: hypothetical protein CR972_00555 [Candidatus Moraniibacteriota bacterium]|nr:MAG: hypothetical protein CR972_00555 [Candidatus Moranbacteria bacterium]